MKLLADFVTAFEYNEAPIVRSVLLQVDKTLEAAKAWPFGVLVLMRPRLVFLEVLAVGEGYVHGIEGYDEVFCSVNLLERANNAGFGSNAPCEAFVTDAVTMCRV